MEKIRVLIADDHPLLRQGLRQTLELSDELEVVGEAADGKVTVELAAALQPDVILMDITMPGMNGVDASREIKERFPDMGIIILTIHDTEEYLMEAVRVGVNGYVLKDIEPEGLLRAIQACHRGETYLQPTLAGKLMSGVSRREQEGRSQDPFEVLTERELEVLRLMSEGVSNREIGLRLYIAEKTVKNHTTNIFRKMGVSDRTQAVIEAIRRGWVKVS